MTRLDPPNYRSRPPDLREQFVEMRRREEEIEAYRGLASGRLLDNVAIPCDAVRSLNSPLGESERVCFSLKTS